MALIAEYRTALTQLSATLAAVPAVTVEHDDAFFTPEGELNWIIWASGGDLSAFEAGLDDDPSVDSYRRITETPERRLYRMTLVGTPDEFTLSAVTELDVQILAATHTHEGTTVRVRCPSREAFVELGAVVEEAYGLFDTHMLYEEETVQADRFGVTPAQREALDTAFEAGYYEVPRRSTLTSVADRLGISPSAASARLRRGTAALLRETVVHEDHS